MITKKAARVLEALEDGHKIYLGGDRISLYKGCVYREESFRHVRDNGITIGTTSSYLHEITLNRFISLCEALSEDQLENIVKGDK